VPHAPLLVTHRPALAAVPRGLDELRIALERERFAAMDADGKRMRAYLAAAAPLERQWPELERQIAALPLRRAHDLVVACASQCLPTMPIATGS